LGLATIFYCLTFETSLFVASYDSQGHGGGIRSRLHTGIGTYNSTSWYILSVAEYRIVDTVSNCTVAVQTRFLPR
jgi:hypothetical protein